MHLRKVIFQFSTSELLAKFKKKFSGQKTAETNAELVPIIRMQYGAYIVVKNIMVKK